MEKVIEEDTFPQTWKLENIFKNSSHGADYKKFIEALEQKFDQLSKAIENKSLVKATALMQELYQDLYTLTAFSTCLFSEDVQNTEALMIQESFRSYQAIYDKLSIKYDLILKELTDKEFESLLENENLSPIKFYLSEKRKKAKDLLSLKEEELICDLSIDGYHGFSQMFDTFHGDLKFELDGETFSYGQIENKISSSDRAERIKAFKVFKQVFKENEANFAQMLNHIAGFRLKVYEKRGWKSSIHEPLSNNRMSEKSLKAMFSSIEHHSTPLKLFMKRKAKLLNLDKLTWHDIDPPLKKSSTLTSYEDASILILDQFEKLSPEFAKFSKRALQNYWIDAEDRANKSAGGFCIGFPLSKESRIFMTYSGTQLNVATLAHELGHAYHNEVIFDLPPFAQTIKMNVAETASTMAEMIVSDALYQMAETMDEKILALDDKISRAIAFCMNLQARFNFEKAFYQERKKGYVLPTTLCSMMEDAQRNAYKDSLSEYHPHFWASKLHFYFTDEPFYNFPYIFGFLFSLGFYEIAKQNPKDFQQLFKSFLEDSAQMSVEKLAKKHLDVDLESSDFWDIGMKSIESDVKEFLKLTE